MTRSLLLTALCAFMAAIGFFVLAGLFGAKDFSGGGRFWEGPFGGRRYDRDARNFDPGGPQVVRTMAWTGDETLSARIPAHIVYTQGPQAGVKVSGPRGTVERVILDDGQLRFDRRFRDAPRLEVEVTAPAVEEFHMMGAQHLEIVGFDRPKLEIHLAGSSRVSGAGTTDEIDLHAAGSSNVDLGAVKARRADVHIAGSGDAIVAPTDEVEVHIAGSGEVSLRTRPAKVETHIAGSGRIIQADETIQPVETKPDAAKPVPAKPAPAKPAPTKTAA